MAEQTVQLLPGQSIELSFKAVPTMARTFQVTVDGLSGSFRAVEPLKYGDLRGRVYDMHTNEPLAGVAVKVGEQTASSSAGEYTIPSLQVGRYSASFSKEGYVTTIYTENLVIREGDNVINVGLAPAPTPTGNLSGIVTDSYNGLPMPDVKVTLTGYIAVGEPPYQSTEQVYYETFTDAQGRYSFTNVLTIDYAVSFIKESYETPVLPIDLQLEDKTLDVKLNWIGAGLRLYFSNPQIGISTWDAELIDLGTMEEIPGTPAGMKEPHVPMDFVIPTLTFLLRVMENPWYPEPGPYWRGPYLVKLPGPGTYTWNSKEGKIDGIASKNLPSTDNESDVVGTVVGWDWLAENAWGLNLLLESSTPVPGKEDVAGLYVGQRLHIRQVQYPADSLGTPIIPVGARVTCKLKMVRLAFDYGWSAWDMRYPREYPPEAYEFSGSLTFVGIVDKQFYDPEAGYYWKRAREYRWSVRGNVPQFAVAVCITRMFIGPVLYEAVVGPAEGTYWILEDDYQFGYASPGPIYAHPNPDAPAWDRYTWELNNWQAVVGA